MMSRMRGRRFIVAGGGAAGFFAAIAAAAEAPGLEVLVLERTAHFLSKVRISGGGRCNVTHHLFDPREFTRRYPRGEKALIGPFHAFQARDTVAWFESRGVRLKTESDGRMFPTTDSSQTIIDCLLAEARKAGVQLRPNHSIERIECTAAGFKVFSQAGPLEADYLLLATGGCRTASQGALARSLGHALAPPVPSLFTFQIPVPWVRELAGLSLPQVQLTVPGTPLREQGPLLFTHWGLSGPGVLRLSAWGARLLHDLDYQFQLVINWLPDLNDQSLRESLTRLREAHPARLVTNTPLAPLPARLWERLVLAAGIPSDTRWAALDRARFHALCRQLLHTELAVSGKSLNKDEFVTCGGVPLHEVNFKTMESKLCPGLYFAGELLDIDGITGGFNFQSAWTTGWLAGRAVAARVNASA